MAPPLSLHLLSVGSLLYSRSCCLSSLTCRSICLLKMLINLLCSTSEPVHCAHFGCMLLTATFTTHTTGRIPCLTPGLPLNPLRPTAQQVTRPASTMTFRLSLLTCHLSSDSGWTSLFFSGQFNPPIREWDKDPFELMSRLIRAAQSVSTGCVYQLAKIRAGKCLHAGEKR